MQTTRSRDHFIYSTDLFSKKLTSVGGEKKKQNKTKQRELRLEEKQEGRGYDNVYPCFKKIRIFVSERVKRKTKGAN